MGHKAGVGESKKGITSRGDNGLKQEIRLIVNGDPYEVIVKPRETLLDVLRDKLKLTGTKKGCVVIVEREQSSWMGNPSPLA